MALTKVPHGLSAHTSIVDGASSTAITIDASGNVGIGTSSIDGTLHVHTASAGTVTASSQADDLVIENSAEGGMTIITPDDQSARIRFTSPSTTADVGGASIFYRQNINKMSMGTEVTGGILALKSGAGSEGLLLDASGNVGIGTSTVESTLHLQESSAGGRGATLTIDNNASSTLGNECQITFLTDAGASVAGTANARIKAINTNAGNGAADITFTTWSGGSEGERMRIDSSGNVGIGVVPAAAYKMQVNVATNTVTTGSPASSSIVNIAGGTTTVDDGVSLQLSNTSGAKETAWRISAVTASGNNGDLVFNGYAGGADYPERMRIGSAGAVTVPGTLHSPGHVIQTVYAENSSLVVPSQTQNDYITLMQVTITPKYSNSKILINGIAAVNLNSGNYPAIHAQIHRGSTNVKSYLYWGYQGGTTTHRILNEPLYFLDSPATTSTITYYIKIANGSGSTYTGTYGARGNQYNTSTVTVQEIAQ